MNLKQSKEGYMGRFAGKTVKGEMIKHVLISESKRKNSTLVSAWREHG